MSIYQNLTQKYLRLFSRYHNWVIKKYFEEFKTLKKAEISYVSQSIKDRSNKEYIVVDADSILYQYLTSPIISNDKVYGVVIFSYAVLYKSEDLGIISLNILIFYILFVLIMIFLSLIFSQSLIAPIKRLSKLTILERERVNENEINYRVDNKLPPLGKMAAIIVSGDNLAKVREQCSIMFGSIPNISELEIYGPAPAPLSKLKGRHRQRFLIHDKKARNMQKIVNAWLKNSKSLSSVNISVDIDPFSFV